MYGDEGKLSCSDIIFHSDFCSFTLTFNLIALTLIGNDELYGELGELTDIFDTLSKVQPPSHPNFFVNVNDQVRTHYMVEQETIS